MGEAGADFGGPRKGGSDLEKLVRRIRERAAVASSLHAFFDRGIMAPVAATTRRAVDCTEPLSRSACREDGFGRRRADFHAARNYYGRPQYSRGDETRRESKAPRPTGPKFGLYKIQRRGKPRYHSAAPGTLPPSLFRVA